MAHRRTTTLAGVVALLSLAAISAAPAEDTAQPIPASAPATTDAELESTALQMATLFRAARSVISTNQALINDADKGDKGLSGETVVAAAIENYAEATGEAWTEPDTSTLLGQAQTAMLASVETVMAGAQSLINEQGKGFKGFLPAVFAKQVATEFSNRMNGTMFIKLTAPKDYVRNRANRPDPWEHDVIENKFRSDGWTTNDVFTEKAEHKGKSGFRLLLPEYYGASCLNCHGEPKGELDITGGKKEGGVLGELGGAISVVIYDSPAG